MISLPAKAANGKTAKQLPDVVRAPRTDAIYNCHSYLTKVPVEAIKPFIEAFTSPGDRVLDMFAGSGMTGLAAISIGRRGALSDISVLGQHIGLGYLARVSAADLRQGAAEVIERARGELGDLYRSRRISDSTDVEMIRTVWSFVYKCPQCDSALVFLREIEKHGHTPTECPSCRSAFSKRRWPRLDDVPVRVVVDGEAGKQVEQEVQALDIERIERATRDKRQALIPSLVISPEREMFSRSGLRGAGISETRQFFSSRNALALYALWNAIGSCEQPSVRSKLRFAFTACLARASRRYQWGPKRPLNAQNQTYYIAPVYYEWNVFELFARKVEAAIRSDELLFRREAPKSVGDEQVEYQIASADRLAHLPDGQIDYVFTDPPFGSNIFYADMTLFHEAWIGRTTNDEQEAVMRTTGPGKKTSAERYEGLMRGAFLEAFRVLKPGGHMSVVFGNSSGRIWALVQRAFRDAGFGQPLHIAILDKGQRSVKGLSSGSEGVVTVDLVMTVQKPKTPLTAIQLAIPNNISLNALLREAASTLDGDHALNPSYIYAATLREAIRRHVPLDGLHYSDVLLGLRQLGLCLDQKKGLLDRAINAEMISIN